MGLLNKLITVFPKGIQINLAKKYLDYKFKKGIKIQVENKEVLDDIKSPIIFVANHLSNIDGIVLSRVLEKFNPYFVAGQKLSKNSFTEIFVKLMKTIQIKPNSADIESMKKIVNTLKEGNNIMMFPEGTRSRTSQMIEAKKGILLIAKLSKATIVPISLMGTEKILPVNKEGAMEKETLKNGEVSVFFGKPFKLMNKPQEMDKEEFEKKALDKIMYSIAENLEPSYKGVYSNNE